MTDKSLRILAASATWQGATDYGFVRAFRRAGHSLTVLSEAEFFPSGWDSLCLRLVRRGLLPAIVASYERALISAAANLKPDIFFVFKGPFVTRRAIESIREMGAVTINYYPDVSFTAHGPHIPKALPSYDWIFTTKSFGLGDMHRVLGITRASFVPHPYDPETHFPASLDDNDKARYACDAAFIGTWSPKKEALLSALRSEACSLDLKIWGSGWKSNMLGPAVMQKAVLGREYAKAISASRVNIAILSEARRDASSGDMTTTRTFEIPAVGGFMLHERSDEAQSYFTEGKDCAMFADADELIAKTRYYIAHPKEREEIARAGYLRCTQSDYSVDARVATIVKKALEIKKARSGSDRSKPQTM